MNYCLFGNHGAFVLFGSKPIAEIILHPSLSDEEVKRIYASLSKETQAQTKISYEPYSPYECWKTWKQNQHRYHFQGFLIVERPLKIDPSAIVILIVNTAKTISTLQDHYDYFKDLSGRDFDPTTEVFNLERADSLFWECLFNDHIAMGILFGFGEQNARSFAKQLQEDARFDHFDCSTSKNIEQFKASQQNFSIPIFRTFEDEEIVKIYQQEHRKIEEVYRKGDVLEITLKKLTGVHSKQKN